jgi:hypothetical protein
MQSCAIPAAGIRRSSEKLGYGAKSIRDNIAGE